jgi:hypothetical protein
VEQRQWLWLDTTTAACGWASTHTPLAMRAWAHYSSNKLSAQQNVLSIFLSNAEHVERKTVATSLQQAVHCA